MLHRVKPGNIVRWNDVDYVVAACKASGTLLTPVAAGEQVWVDMISMGADESFDVLGDLPDGHSQQERVALETLTAAQKEQARWWRDHILEVEHGVKDPTDPESRPRAGYDVTSVTKRRELKAQELTNAGHPVDVRTLSRKAKAYRDGGITALVHQGGRKKSGPSIDSRIEEAVVAVLAETTQQSSVSITALMKKVRVHAERAHPGEALQWCSDSTLRRYIHTHDHRDHARKKATSRRSDSNRADRMFNPIVAHHPGQYVEIDSTPVNFMVKMPGGTTMRPHLSAMLDVATRSIIGWAFHAGAASGYDHSLMLARTLRPRQVRDGMSESLRLNRSSVLPHPQMVASDANQAEAIALPYIVPETVTIDRGKDYMSLNAMESFRLFGISVIQAPPHSPTAKPHVERALGTVETMWMAYHDWYVGNSPEHRGREQKGEPIPFEDLDDSFTNWVVRVYQNTPHAGLRDREQPGRMFSPNQMYAALFDVCAGVPVPIDENVYISLMPRVERQIRSDGVQFRSEVYDAPSLDGLRGHKTKREVRYDPYDTDRVWVRHPESDEWIECVARGIRLSALPFGGAVAAALAGMEPADSTLQDKWANETLHQQATNSKARKMTAKQKSQTRRTQKATAAQKSRALENLPTPGPVAVPDLPPVSLTRHSSDFAIGNDGEDMWNV